MPGAWGLESYDVNDAGQVHAYLCYLRHFPHQEQLHWKSHNEEPKGTISKRAFENDFQGDRASYETPLERVLSIIREWARCKVYWWGIEDRDLLLRINTPVSSSKDEWGSAFPELSKAVIEGFQVTPLRSPLRQKQISFDDNEQSLSLMRKLLSDKTGLDEGLRNLEGLRLASRIRSTVASHGDGSKADQIAKDALSQHGTYRGHFDHVCNQVADEIELIEQVLGSTDGNG